ncbi:MAG: hypothetical protein HY558_01145 [Euryarchaeota archaeon]|nr:hypothetical protein [Euryarchaeota archaeon]
MAEPHDVNFIGVGGCGRKILHDLLARRSAAGEGEPSGALFFDLSDDLDFLYKDLAGVDYVDVKPKRFAGGVGRVPMSAEYIAGNLIRLFNYPETVFVPRIANIYLHSLGGGTGSGAVPMLIDVARGPSQVGVHLTCSVFTDGPVLENVNHLYTFKRCNEKADLVIVVENRALEKRLRELYPDQKEMPLEVVNEHIVNILDLVTAARKPGAYPGIHDFKNYVNHLAMSPLYREGVRWLVPVTWPPLGRGAEPQPRRYTPFGWILRALKEGPICEGVELEKSRLGILILEGPFEGYLSNVDMAREVRRVEHYLGMGERSIIYTLVPREDGLRVCLLLYPPPFRRLRQLAATGDDEMAQAREGWKHGSQHDLREIRLDGTVEGLVIEQALVRLQRKIENVDPRGDLLQMLKGVDRRGDEPPAPSPGTPPPGRPTRPPGSPPKARQVRLPRGPPTEKR